MQPHARDQQTFHSAAHPDVGVRLQTDVITDWSQVAVLASEWNPLLALSQNDTIFLTWEWINSWREAVAPSTSPMVVTVRRPTGELIGIAPLYHTRYVLLRSIPYRFLRVMADHATGAEYPSWILSADYEPEAALAIVQALDTAGPKWDCIWMPNMSGWTGGVSRLFAACDTAGWSVRSRPQTFGNLELPSHMDAYLQSLSQNRRAQLRSEQKRFAQRPGLEVRRCRTADELPSFLEALFDLHHRRRMLYGDPGTFRRRPAEADFYRHFTRVALARSWLSLHALLDNGEFRAVQIGYIYNRTYFQLQEGFDPSYIKGVGNYLRLKVIEACITDGVTGFDFLGEMTEHKRRWSARERLGSDVLIARRTFKNNIVSRAGFWPTGRYLCPPDGSHPTQRGDHS